MVDLPQKRLSLLPTFRSSTDPQAWPVDVHEDHGLLKVERAVAILHFAGWQALRAFGVSDHASKMNLQGSKWPAGGADYPTSCSGIRNTSHVETRLGTTRFHKSPRRFREYSGESLNPKTLYPKPCVAGLRSRSTRSSDSRIMLRSGVKPKEDRNTCSSPASRQPFPQQGDSDLS